MQNKLTQINLYDGGAYTGFGNIGQGSGGITTFSNIISSAIGLMTIVGIIWFVFVFITGALGILTSGGDKASLESAKKKISTGLIGFIVVILAVLIIKLIGSLIGIDVLNIQTMFSTLQI